MDTKPHRVCPRPQIDLLFRKRIGSLAWTLVCLNPLFHPIRRLESGFGFIGLCQDELCRAKSLKRGLKRSISPEEACFDSFHCLRKQ